MQTYMANPDKIERKWYVVDAEGCTLGRLASGVASVLRGKNKPQFTPHVDTGDYVIVVNADKIKVTGKKMDQKIYYNHSDYVGGMKETTLKEMMAKKPEKVVELAVKGMLPKGPLGREMYTKLFVYAGPEHKHAAQKPEKVIELAVKGMLPKGPMGRDMIKKLHVYAGPDHAHQAQKPEVLTF